jgi:hypothetical protein
MLGGFEILYCHFSAFTVAVGFNWGFISKIRGCARLSVLRIFRFPFYPGAFGFSLPKKTQISNMLPLAREGEHFGAVFYSLNSVVVRTV